MLQERGFWGASREILPVVQSWPGNEKTPGGRNRSEHSSLGRVFLIRFLWRPCERSLERDRGASRLPASRTDLAYGVTAKAFWGAEQLSLAPEGVTATLRVPREVAPRSGCSPAPICKHLLCNCRRVSCSTGRSRGSGKFAE